MGKRILKKMVSGMLFDVLTVSFNMIFLNFLMKFIFEINQYVFFDTDAFVKTAYFKILLDYY